MAAKLSADDHAHIRWEPLVPAGPNLAYHAGCIVNNNLYIHGGITVKGSSNPSNQLHRLNLEDLIWWEVECEGSPALSHHACAVRQSRYIIMVGGWDGKVRSSNVHIYDTTENKWLHPVVSGFPDGAGLSSHTTTVLHNGDILVLGREGSLRIQKRFGNAYVLSGDIDRGVFHYSDFLSSVTSRSGHSASLVGSSLYVIGGRDDQLCEVYRRISSGKSDCNSIQAKLDEVASTLAPVKKHPCGRKCHVSVSGKSCIMIHGGETFDGRSREPVGEMYILGTKPTLQWYQVFTQNSIARAGHICCSDGKRILTHGGTSGKSKINFETYELVFG